jgi:hypothetical protein
LKQFILRRAKVEVKDESSRIAAHVVFGIFNAHGTSEGYMVAVDPRHPYHFVVSSLLPKNLVRSSVWTALEMPSTMAVVNVNKQVPRPWLMASQVQSKLMIE